MVLMLVLVEDFLLHSSFNEDMYTPGAHLARSFLTVVMLV